MRTFALSIATAIALTSSAIAQTGNTPENVFILEQGTDHYLAYDNLIGAKVQNDDGAIIGDIEDLIINDTNTVIGVVMGTGGVLGVGEKRVGVELAALEFKEKDGITHVVLANVSNETLDGVNPFQRSKPPKSLFQRAQEKARELSDKTAATSKEAYEAAKPSLDQAKERARDAYDKAKDAAGPAVEAAKKAASEAVGTTEDGTSSGTEPAPSE